MPQKSFLKKIPSQKNKYVSLGGLSFSDLKVIFLNKLPCYKSNTSKTSFRVFPNFPSLKHLGDKNSIPGAMVESKDGDVVFLVGEICVKNFRQIFIIFPKFTRVVNIQKKCLKPPLGSNQKDIT